MADSKQIILWEPKRAEKRRPDGSIMAGEFTGKFRTKVQAGTPNAIRHFGENAAGVKWDYWGVDVDSVNGIVRWVDIRTNDYGSQIVLFLETPKSLHQITIPYDVRNVHRVMNHLCGLGKDLETAWINVSYWVRKKTDQNGNVKTDDKGAPVWAKDLSFRDVPEKFTFEEWKEFSQKEGLDWFQETRAGKKVWNFEAELNYWTGRLVLVQRYLLGTEKVLPFCWNSITASTEGLEGLTLTAAEIGECTRIYERIKPLYIFPFSRVEVSADEVDLVPGQSAAAKPDNGFPTEEPVSGNAVEIEVPGDFDDLPF